MTLRTWWLENRLRGVDRKLRRLRFAQKRVRDSERTLHEAKRSGRAPVDHEGREAALQQRRERLAQEIAVLMGMEQRLKAELREHGVSLSSH